MVVVPLVGLVRVRRVQPGRLPLVEAGRRGHRGTIHQLGVEALVVVLVLPAAALAVDHRVLRVARKELEAAVQPTVGRGARLVCLVARRRRVQMLGLVVKVEALRLLRVAALVPVVLVLVRRELEEPLREVGLR